MSKTLLYFAILVVLSLGIYFFLIKPGDGPYSASEAGFTITDTASIGKLYLVSNNGESILAERTDTGWIVNKKYKALKSTLNLILATLNKQSAMVPVTKNAHDNVIKDLSTNGIKLEVYDRAGKKMKVMYVGGTAVNNTGTNMWLEGASTPYVVQVPGFNGYLTSRFTTALRDWRDRTVFDLPESEIKSVSVTYLDKPLNSFEIIRENGKLTVKGDPSYTKYMDTPNTHRAGLYLSYFKNINCEGFLNGLPDNDTTLKTAPKQSSIDVFGMHGQHQHANIYWMALNRRSKNITASNFDVPDDYDADRLYAVINDKKDTVMIQMFVFNKIFRRCSEFFTRDIPPAPKPKPNELPAAILNKKK